MRRATEEDVNSIRVFGKVVLDDTYAPIVSAAYADEMLARWWSADELRSYISNEILLIALEAPGADGADHGDGATSVIGLVNIGTFDAEPVMWKLYVHPDHRSCGIGPRLIDAGLVELDDTATVLRTEHIVANRRVVAFYERNGFAFESVSGDPDDPISTVWRSRAL